MKKLFIIIVFLLFSSSLFAEFILEPVICTTKKPLIVELISIILKLEKFIFVTQKNVKKLKLQLKYLLKKKKKKKKVDH